MSERFVVPDKDIFATGLGDAIRAVDLPAIVQSEVEVFFRWWTDERNFGPINDTRTNADYFAAFCRQRFGEPHPPATRVITCGKCDGTGKWRDDATKTCSGCEGAGRWTKDGPSRGEPEATFDAHRVFKGSVRHAEPQPSTTNAVMPEMLPSCRACSCASCGAVRDFVQALAKRELCSENHENYTEYDHEVWDAAIGVLK